MVKPILYLYQEYHVFLNAFLLSFFLHFIHTFIISILDTLFIDENHGIIKIFD